MNILQQRYANKAFHFNFDISKCRLSRVRFRNLALEYIPAYLSSYTFLLVAPMFVIHLIKICLQDIILIVLLESKSAETFTDPMYTSKKIRFQLENPLGQHCSYSRGPRLVPVLSRTLSVFFFFRRTFQC